jgi:hypothetical protein
MLLIEVWAFARWKRPTIEWSFALMIPEVQMLPSQPLLGSIPRVLCDEIELKYTCVEGSADGSKRQSARRTRSSHVTLRSTA